MRLAAWVTSSDDGEEEDAAAEMRLTAWEQTLHTSDRALRKTLENEMAAEAAAAAVLSS